MAHLNSGSICTVILLTLAATSFSVAQEKTRTLEHGKFRMYDRSTEPIAIISREVGNKPFESDSKVVSGRDWLRNLSLTIKNISAKTITEFEINLIIAKQANMTGDVVLIVRFPMAKPILDSAGEPTGEHTLIRLLKTDEVIKVRISENQLRLLDLVKKGGVSDIDNVSLVFRSVTFDDGIRWFQGIEMRQDPNDPGNWLTVPAQNPPTVINARDMDR
ncbi:MAG: hypothetical protein AB7J13_01475 [Pyrinomonadaceae bacterium]